MNSKQKLELDTDDALKFNSDWPITCIYCGTTIISIKNQNQKRLNEVRKCSICKNNNDSLLDTKSGHF
jgi:hypothetical protein